MMYIRFIYYVNYKRTQVYLRVSANIFIWLSIHMFTVTLLPTFILLRSHYLVGWCCANSLRLRLRLLFFLWQIVWICGLYGIIACVLGSQAFAMSGHVSGPPLSGNAVGSGDIASVFSCNITMSDESVVMHVEPGGCDTSMYRLTRSMTGDVDVNIHDGGCEQALTSFTGSGTLYGTVLSGDAFVCNDSIAKEASVESDVGTGNTPSNNASIRVSEIHPKDDTLPEYIELYMTGSMTGMLEIVGLGRGSATKSIDLTILNSGYIVITDNPLDLPSMGSGAHVIQLSSISLTDSGQMLTLVYNDNIIQEVLYEGSTTDMSWYGSGGSFDQSDVSTPGFGRSYSDNESDTVPEQDNESDLGTGDVEAHPDNEIGHVDFLPSQCDLLRQHDKYVVGGKKINLIATWSGDVIHNSRATFACVIDMGDDTVYDECNPSYHTYVTSGLYNVRARIIHNDIPCYAHATVNYIHSQDDASNSDTQDDTSSYDELLDIIGKSGYRRTGDRILPIADMSMRDTIALTGVIAIDAVLPDAEGKDTGAEGIRLMHLRGDAFDLSGSYLQVGRSKKYFDGILSPGTSQTFVQTWGLRNSVGCIYLMSRDHMLMDQFCYRNPQQGEWIESSIHALHVDPYFHRAGMSFEAHDESVCLMYKGEIIACHAPMHTLLEDHAGLLSGVVDAAGNDTKTTIVDSADVVSNCLDMSCLDTKTLRNAVLPYYAGSGSVQIKALLPNPDGKDSGNEVIYLTHSHIGVDSKHISATGDRMSYLSGYTLRSGRKHIDVGLLSGVYTDGIWYFTGSFGLRNSENCVYLHDNRGRLDDQFCYDRAPSGVLLTGSRTFLESHPLFVWSDMSLVQDDNMICLEQHGIRMACRAGYNVTEVDKKIASYEKKASKAQEKYEKQKAKYAQCVERKKELDVEDKRQRKKIRESVAKQKVKWRADVKKQREKNTLLSTQMREQRATNRLLDDYVDSMTSRMNAYYYDIGAYNETLTWGDVYSEIDKRILSGGETYDYSRMSVDIADVDNVYTLYRLEHDVMEPLQVLAPYRTVHSMQGKQETNDDM